MFFDVFNGDADGICALLQLRLAEPREASLITGVKRDISLLQRVTANPGDQVTVLDVSMEKNQTALRDLLDQQVGVFYVDHHQPGDIPDHPGLQALIDTDANVCTSLLVDRHLQHRFSAWAVVAAFGDNLAQSALQLAGTLNLSEQALLQLQQLGICINYNAYGSTVEDLHFAPDSLYRSLSGYESPFDFIADREDVFAQLTNGYAEDMALAQQVTAEYLSEHAAVFILPNEKWARRVSGVWSNDLANKYPDRAHAVLSPHVSGGYVVSVRAPLNNKHGADELCTQFPGGGGRRAAAGINQLATEMLAEFIAAFSAKYSMVYLSERYEKP